MSHESFATTIEDLTPCTDRSSLATQLPPACQVGHTSMLIHTADVMYMAAPADIYSAPTHHH